jgi:hypothetical protein
MKTQTLVQGALAALGLGIVATAADAATITIEPDNYLGQIGDVAPGATLSTFRSLGMNSFTKKPVLSVLGGTWAPTGIRVFGHAKESASETIHHWDYLSKAYFCEHFNMCDLPFYAFRVEFDTPTNLVSVLTTMRGEQAMDGAELHAFNEQGVRIMRCRVLGIDQGILQSGILPAPRYVVPNATGRICGSILAKKNCVGASPGNCDFVVQLNVTHTPKDIKFAMFGGLLLENTWAPVDRLQYRLD